MRVALRWFMLIILIVGGGIGSREYIRYTVTHSRHEMNPKSVVGPVGYYYVDWRRDWPDPERLRDAAEAGVLRTNRAVESIDGFRPDPIGVIQASLSIHDQLLDQPESWKTSILVDQLDWLMAEAHWLPDSSAVWPCYWQALEHGITEPWISALTQGQATSLFTRAHQMFGDDIYLEWAEYAARSLLDPNSCLVSNEVGPFLEEFPTQPRSGVLNGCLFAWLGLWDLVRVTKDGDLRIHCLGLLDSFEIQMPIYADSDWTYYDAYRRKIASPAYQEIHAAIAESIAELTGRPDWEKRADRWRSAAESRPAMTQVFFRTVVREARERIFGRPVPAQRNCPEFSGAKPVR